MKSLELLKLERIRQLTKELEKVSSYLNRFPNDSFFQEKLHSLVNVFDNYPEYIRQLVVHEAFEYVEMRTNWKINKYSNLLNIKQEDEVSKIVDKVTSFNSKEADDAIQKIYESFGYTDKLPLEELHLLEQELVDTKRTSDLDNYSEMMKRFKVLKNYVGAYSGGYTNFKTTEQLENELGLQRVIKK